MEMTKKKKYFIAIATKKIFAALKEKYGTPLYGVLVKDPFFGFYELLYLDYKFTADEYFDGEVEPFHYLIPTTAKKLKKEVKYLGGHY